MLNFQGVFFQILQLLIRYGADCNKTLRPVWGDHSSRIHAIAAAALNNYPKCVELLAPRVNRRILKRTEVSFDFPFS